MVHKKDMMDLLDKPLTSLRLSAGFDAQSRQMGLGTLQEVLDAGPRGLVERDGFSYHWLAEISSFLQERQLLHLLQPFPESSCD